MMFREYFNLKFSSFAWFGCLYTRNQLNFITRSIAVGTFIFILLGKIFSDKFFLGVVELNSFAFAVFLAPLVAGALLIFEPSNHWVRVLGLLHPTIIFVSTCVLVSFLEYSESRFSIYFEFYLLDWVVPVGVDNSSILFVVLTSFLFSLTFLSCWANTSRTLFFFVLLFLTEFILFFVPTVLDPFWFFIAYESVIVPVFLIIGIWGGRIQRVYAAYLFLYYTFAGSVAMLSSILYIYLLVGSTSFSVVMGFEFTVLEQIFLFSSFFVAFAAKLPLYPFHSWLPEAHVEAPTAGSVLLAGILLKMGGYGLIRWCFSLFPFAAVMAVDVVNTIASISVLYASFSALQQLDIKKIIAYSSIAHMGFVVMGLFTFTELGFLGAISLMITHGLISAGLFLCIGVLYDRYGTRSVLYYGGFGRFMPLYDTIFFILCLANTALPGMAGFPGEFLILCAVYPNSPVLFVILLFGVLLTGVYTIWMYSRVMMGPVDSSHPPQVFADVSIRELCVLGTLLIPIFVFGLFPILLFHFYDLWIFKWLSI